MKLLQIDPSCVCPPVSSSHKWPLQVKSLHQTDVLSSCSLWHIYHHRTIGNADNLGPERWHRSYKTVFPTSRAIAIGSTRNLQRISTKLFIVWVLEEFIIHRCVLKLGTAIEYHSHFLLFWVCRCKMWKMYHTSPFFVLSGASSAWPFANISCMNALCSAFILLSELRFLCSPKNLLSTCL